MSYAFKRTIRASEAQDFQPIPEDFYTVRIEGCEHNTSRDGDMEGVKITYVIAEEGNRYNGRKIFRNFWLEGPACDKDTSDKAYNQLAGIAKAVGIEELNRPEQLINKLFYARVTVTENRESGRKNNNVFPARNDAQQNNRRSFQATRPQPTLQAQRPQDPPFNTGEFDSDLDF